jgi:hypothetical protein
MRAGKDMVEKNLSVSEELARSLQYTSASKQCGIETIEKLSQQNGMLMNFESAEFMLPLSTIIH